jgi:hypothetical protein
MSFPEWLGCPGPARLPWVCEIEVAEPRLEPAPDLEDAPFGTNSFDDLDGPLMNEPPHPINWNLLSSEEAEVE